jgi:hypothetical protein
MRIYGPLIEQIEEQTGAAFRAASPFELSKLEALGLPQSVPDFYEPESGDGMKGCHAKARRRKGFDEIRRSPNG